MHIVLSAFWPPNGKHRKIYMEEVPYFLFINPTFAISGARVGYKDICCMGATVQVDGSLLLPFPLPCLPFHEFSHSVYCDALAPFLDAGMVGRG